MNCSPVIRSKHVCAALILILGQAACTRHDAGLPVAPDTSAFEPAVRETLQDGRAQLEAALESGASNEALGVAFGELGMRYLAHHLAYAAVPMFERAAALEPDEFRWPYLLAVALQEQGEFQPALEWYDRALAIDGEYTAATLRRAETLFELGMIDTAELAFQSAGTNQIDSAAALAGLGNIAMWRKDYAFAVELYSKAILASPRSDQLRYPLSQALARSGRRDEAKRQLALAGQNRPPISDPLIGEVEERSRSAQLYLEKGMALIAAGYPQQAIASIREAVALDASDAYSQATLGQALLLNGQRDEAQTVLEEAVALDSTLPIAYYHLGTIFEMRGVQVRADELYAQAIELDPAIVEARLLLANSLMRQREYWKAQVMYEDLVSLAPGEALFSYRVAILAQVTGNCATAMTAIERAAELAPSDGDVLQASARVWSSCSDTTETRRREALEIAQLLYGARPGIDTLETLALASAATGSYAEARKFQKQAIAQALANGETNRAAAMQVARTDFEARRVPVSAYNDHEPSLRPAPLR